MKRAVSNKHVMEQKGEEMEFRGDAGRQLQNPSLRSRWSSVTVENGNDVLILENTVKESILKYMKYWPKGLKGRTR